MGLHNDVATQLAAHAAAVAGITGASATPVDSIPSTPYVVIGPPKGQFLQPGSWERLLLTFPMTMLIARVGSSDRDQVQINDLLDLFLTGWRASITLGGLVTEALIRSWDTNRVYGPLNGSEWQAIEFVVGVEVERGATYTA